MAIDLESLLDDINDLALDGVDGTLDGKEIGEKIQSLLRAFNVAAYDDSVISAAEDDIRSAERERIDEEESPLDNEVYELHEMICEGRKQDAIDRLGDIFPNVSLRRVATQNSLFPDRVQS